MLRNNSISIYSSYIAQAWLLPITTRDLSEVLEGLRGKIRENGFSLGAIDLYLIDDAQMAQANFRYMGIKGPTNILSFPGDGQFPSSLLLSLDTWARECRLFGQKPLVHLFFLLSHGLLHLAGLDHGGEMARLQGLCMRSFEQEYGDLGAL